MNITISLWHQVDAVFRMRSLGTATTGLTDQYADGKAAKVWALYIGDISRRTDNYRQFITSLLEARGVRTVLDAACGTGVDSVMLLEEVCFKLANFLYVCIMNPYSF